LKARTWIAALALLCAVICASGALLAAARAPVADKPWAIGILAMS